MARQPAKTANRADYDDQPPAKRKKAAAKDKEAPVNTKKRKTDAKTTKGAKKAASMKRKTPTTPAANGKRQRVPMSAKRKTPAALRTGTYVIEGAAPEPESDSEDELLLVGREWADRIIRSTKKRRISRTRSVPGNSGLRETSTASSRKVRFSTGPHDEEEEPQDTFAYTNSKESSRSAVQRSPSPAADGTAHDFGFANGNDPQYGDNDDGQDHFHWGELTTRVPDHEGSPLRGQVADEADRAIESLHGSPRGGSMARVVAAPAVLPLPADAPRLDASLDMDVDENADTLLDDISAQQPPMTVEPEEDDDADTEPEEAPNEIANASATRSVTPFDAAASGDSSAGEDFDVESLVPPQKASPLRVDGAAALKADLASVEADDEVAADLETESADEGLEELEAEVSAIKEGTSSPQNAFAPASPTMHVEAEEQESVPSKSDRMSPELQQARRSSSLSRRSASPAVRTPLFRPADSPVPASPIRLETMDVSPRQSPMAPAVPDVPVSPSPLKERENSLTGPEQPIQEVLMPELATKMPVMEAELDLEDGEMEENGDSGMQTDSTEEIEVSLTMEQPPSPRAALPLTSTPARFGKKLAHALPDVSPPIFARFAGANDSHVDAQMSTDAAPQPSESGAKGLDAPREEEVELDSEEENQLRAEDSPEAGSTGKEALITPPRQSVANESLPLPSPIDEAAAVALRGLSLSPVEEFGRPRTATPPSSNEEAPQVPASLQKTPSASPQPQSRERIITEGSTPGRAPAPRPSLSSVMQANGSSSDEEEPVNEEYLSGLVSPTTLALSSPNQARRLQALASSVSVRPGTSPASQSARPFSSPAVKAAAQTPTQPSPAHSAPATLTSRFSRLFGIRSGGSEAKDDESLRDTPEADRTHPQTPKVERSEDSDDSLRDTPTHERSQHSIFRAGPSPPRSEEEGPAAETAKQLAPPVSNAPIQLAPPFQSSHPDPLTPIEEEDGAQRPFEPASPIEEAVEEEEDAAIEEHAIEPEEEEETIEEEEILEAEEVSEEEQPSDQGQPPVEDEETVPMAVDESQEPEKQEQRTPSQSPGPAQHPSPFLQSPSRMNPVSLPPASTSRTTLVGKNGRNDSDLEAHDLLVDDNTLYSGEGFDPTQLAQPQPVSSGAALNTLYAYTSSRSASPAVAPPAPEQEAEEPQGTIYPPDASPATPEAVNYSEVAVAVLDPDSEEAATRRRSSLGIRPPTPGRIRGSVFVATPGASPARAPRLSPAVRLAANAQPNLRVVLQTKQSGIPRRVGAAPDSAAELARATSQTSAALQRAISPPLRERERTRSNSLAQPSPRQKHDKDSFVEIRSSDPKLAARVAALLKVEHRFVNQDSSAEDSMQADESTRLLREAEEDIASQMDEDSIAGRRRSPSPFFPRHRRSMSTTSGQRSRHASANDTFTVPQDLRTATPMPPLGQRVGDQWTKDDWRRLEQVLRDEQHRSQLNAVDEPSDEEIARVFLFAEGVMRDQCEKHWSWDKLTIRVHALRQTRCRPLSASLPSRGGLGSRASSVALEHYRNEPARQPVPFATSTPARAASAPPVPPPATTGGLFAFAKDRAVRPTASTTAVLGTSTPSSSIAPRRGLLSMLGLVGTPLTGSPAPRRPPVPLFHEASPPRRAIESQSEPGNVAEWASHVQSETSVPNVSSQIQAIEERVQTLEKTRRPPASRLPQRSGRLR